MSMIPLSPITTTSIASALQSDAQYWRSVIQWANQRYNAYNQELTTTVMNGLAITAADQAVIEAFVGDLNRFITLAGGTLPANASNMTFNATALLGLI